MWHALNGNAKLVVFASQNTYAISAALASGHSQQMSSCVLRAPGETVRRKKNRFSLSKMKQ